MSMKQPRSPIRLIALLVLVIPGAIGMYGWKLMRDATFTFFDPELAFQWGAFLLGLVFFLLGVSFVGGYIFYRDKKRKLVQSRFRDDMDE